MRVVIQRVSEAGVVINGNPVSAISKGLLVLVGIENADSEEDVNWIAGKIASLRIFNDEDGKMNLSVNEIEGEVLVVSQFTLHAHTKKGNRPSFIRAAQPDFATKLYHVFLKKLDQIIDQKVCAGIFGADMKVNLVNDGPVTILIDSKNKE